MFYTYNVMFAHDNTGDLFLTTALTVKLKLMFCVVLDTAFSFCKTVEVPTVVAVYHLLLAAL